MRVLKCRLRIKDKVVGYEMWILGDLHYNGLWYYSEDGSHWHAKGIPHKQKDQFTGLCDKKGKEGYHKDICRIPKDHAWPLFRQKKPVIATIEWDRGCFYLMCSLNRENRYCPIENLKYSEIIGNTFQNKNLMEGKP